MANPEHLEVLAQGVNVWNGWRDANHGTVPDLVDVRLPGHDLFGANFRLCKLAGADLSSCDLRRSHLSGADLCRANLRGARLRSARFCGSDLREADLRESKLFRTDFTAANLKRADLTGATLHETFFLKTDLAGATGLDTCHHNGPSTIDHRTMMLSGVIPVGFLRGCGLPERFVQNISVLFWADTIVFCSCFISYSTKDQEFADRLYADLQESGVRCWFAPHDIQAGKKIHEQIDHAIRLYDRLLLILSGSSMSSEWVKTEIAHARQKELDEERQVLFPISLEPFARIREWRCFDADTGKDSAREIREYFIPDFSNWKDRDSYQEAFQRLVRDLKAAS